MTSSRPPTKPTSSREREGRENHKIMEEDYGIEILNLIPTIQMKFKTLTKPSMNSQHQIVKFAHSQQ